MLPLQRTDVSGPKAGRKHILSMLYLYASGMVYLTLLHRNLIGKRFVLGSCACGCGEPIKIKHSRGLQIFKHFHNTQVNKRNPSFRAQTHGYLLAYLPDHPFSHSTGYIREHRLVWEKYHNAMLLPWAVIHHINGNKKDNRIENLEVTNRSKHKSKHTKDMSKRTCNDCQKNKTFFDKCGHQVWYKDGEGFICANCYNNRTYHRKKKQI